jgi:hypothetical protein
MKRHRKQHKTVAPLVERVPIKAAPSPFVDPPAKREPLRVSLGSALLRGGAAVVGSAVIGGQGAVVG